MKRKKWTPKEEITASDIRFREKRKWQIALRRYILEKNPCVDYAPYFGLDIENFRKWIALQFTEGLNWENFGTEWQFDHIMPVTYFDFEKEEDLALCWNFINIRIEPAGTDKNKANRVDVLAARSYFEALSAETGYPVCRKMADKISALKESRLQGQIDLAPFLKENGAYLQTLAGFNSYEFSRLNEGESLENIVLEKEIIKKFGG